LRDKNSFARSALRASTIGQGYT